MTKPVVLAARVRRIARAIVTTAIFAFVALGASPASAHSELIASTPAQDSTQSDVSSVSLTFGEEVVPEYTSLTLTTISGNVVALEAPTMDATNTVVSAMITSAPLVDDAYILSFYIVSIDGHPIEGSINFVVAGSPASSAAPTPLDSAAPESTAPESAPAESPVALAIDARSTAANGEFSWVWIGTGIAAVLVLATVSTVLLVAIRRRRNSE